MFAVISGCTVAPPKLDKEAEQQAIAFQESGNMLAAAEEYTRLARENGYYAEYFYLKAARNYLDANAPDAADDTLKKLRPDKLDDIQEFERIILTARVALARDDELLALHTLKSGMPEKKPPRLQAEYHLTRAVAFEKDKQIIDAFLERVKYGAFIESENIREENRKQIWKLISTSELTELEEGFQTADKNSEESGWLELGIISKTSLYDLPVLESSIESWLKRYPNHPADPDTIRIIQVLAREANQLPKKIALLLPFNSQYREFSNAIRDGFLTAWYNSAGEKPDIRIYDSSQGNITDIYQKAVDAGAEFIVGPLEKESIERLISSNTMTTRTLTLNRVENDNPSAASRRGPDVTPMIYQFGLVPEDEAQQAAERIWLDGHSRALIITPDNNWGDRIFNAFRTHWSKLGGTIVDHVRIFDSTRDYATPVEQLLNINQSKQRARELMSTLGRKIYFEPRRRHDSDIIFIVATANMARQIVPQLRFYDAANIDTYSISSVFTGVYDPSKDSDIDNVIFSDMPWVIDPAYKSSSLQQQLNRAWQQENSPYRRLYAFGIDAYQIIPYLGSLYIQGNSYSGNTGELAVNREGQVKRHSVWARFVNGTPVMEQR